MSRNVRSTFAATSLNHGTAPLPPFLNKVGPFCVASPDLAGSSTLHLQMLPTVICQVSWVWFSKPKYASSPQSFASITCWVHIAAFDRPKGRAGCVVHVPTRSSNGTTRAKIYRFNQLGVQPSCVKAHSGCVERASLGPELTDETCSRVLGVC